MKFYRRQVIPYLFETCPFSEAPYYVDWLYCESLVRFVLAVSPLCSSRELVVMFSALGKPSSVEVRDCSLVTLVDSLTMSLLLVLHMFSNTGFIFPLFAPAEPAREPFSCANWRLLSEKIEQNSGF